MRKLDKLISKNYKGFILLNKFESVLKAWQLFNPGMAVNQIPALAYYNNHVNQPNKLSRAGD